MKFNVWIVIALALLPAAMLFVGLSAADAFGSAAEWDVIALFGAAAGIAAWLIGS